MRTRSLSTIAAGLTFLIVSILTAPVYAETVLFKEDFQSGQASSWGAGGKGDVRLNNYRGNISMQLARRAFARTVVALEGIEQITVAGALAASDLEGNDACLIEGSIDGGVNWVEAVRIANGKDDGVTLHRGQTTIRNIGNAKNLIIQLRIDANADNDLCWADDILVTGVSKTAARIEFLEPDMFNGGSAFLATAQTSAFAPSAQSSSASNSLIGRVKLREGATADLLVRLDARGKVSEPGSQIGSLPPFDFEFVQSGKYLIPVQRGSIPSAHSNWEFILEPGRVWDEPGDAGMSRAALPFTLQERNANCMHNGLMAFQFKSDGSRSKALFQITSETCAYLQFDMWGVAELEYIPSDISGSDAMIREFDAERKAIGQVLPFSALASKYPVIDPADFGSAKDVDPSSMTLFGFVIDGEHYAGGCETRAGTHPYCDRLNVPSYSVAKAIFAGIGLARLSQLYPEAPSALISDYVPECARAGTWRGVTFEHTADMVVGNYRSTVYDEDERSEDTWPFWGAESHEEKIQLACNTYSSKAKPGRTWVYHTSDTYVLGTAMDAFLQAQLGADADVYRDLIYEPVLAQLGFGPASAVSRRTRDDTAQAFAGWGLTFVRADIANLASFLITGDGRINAQQVVSPDRLRAALQQDPADRGYSAVDGVYFYNDGFWAWDVSDALNCKTPTWVPFLSGYGGVTIALFPNQSAYYFVSDGFDYQWLTAAVASHKIRPMCESK